MEKYFLAAMQRVRGLGLEDLQRLLDVFGDMEAVWRASAAELAGMGGISLRVAQSIENVRQMDMAAPARLAEDCQRQGIAVCSILEENYPPLLREIFHPPLALFYRGSLKLGDVPLAMVGARKCSSYGRSIAKELAARLSGAGVVVVSGAARGIDTASHQGALEQGRTVAVLGCGVDVAYPAENQRLLAEIAEKGAVVSEYAPGTKPLPAYFPSRNRIISGMSRGTVVVEAAERSGSLITAELALSEGRDVFAVPGSLYSPTSRGCHRLIQQGAKLVAAASDVLGEYGIEQEQEAVSDKGELAAMSPEEAAVYSVLSFECPLSMDEIIYSLKDGEAANVAFLLLQMELKGLVVENEAHAYLRAGRMN